MNESNGNGHVKGFSGGWDEGPYDVPGMQAKGTSVKDGTRVSLTEEEARARGVDGFGHPLGPTSHGAPAGGGSKLHSQIRRMEEGGVNDQYELHGFCMDGRQIFQNLAVLVTLSGGTLKADGKRLAREKADNSLTLKQKVKLAWALRRVGNKLNNSADYAAMAAGQMVAAWGVMAAALDEIEQEGKEKLSPPSKKGFRLITGKKGGQS